MQTWIAKWTLIAGLCLAAQATAAQERQVDGFELSGRFDTHAEVRTSPVVAAGSLFIGAENGNLYALDLATRKLKWLFHAQGGISSTPAVAGGSVYFLSRDGRLHALNAETGVPLWSFRTQGEASFSAHGMFGLALSAEPVRDPFDLFLSSPLVHDGKVYFGSSDQRVYALDARSGKPVWVAKTGGMVHSSPALAGKNIVVGSWDGALYALDAASGEQRWRFQTQTEQKTSAMIGIQATPRAHGDSVYIGSRDGYFYALDSATGKQNWRYDAQGSWIVSGAAFDAGTVYFGTSDTGLLLALDQRTGKERFRFSTDVWTFATPLATHGMLIGASMKGQLHLLDPVSGKQRWSYRTAAATEDAFRVVDAATGKLDSKRLFGGGAHTLDSSLEHVKRLGAFLSAPLWHDGQLIVTNANGEVLFFKPVYK